MQLIFVFKFKFKIRGNLYVKTHNPKKLLIFFFNFLLLSNQKKI